MNKNLIYIVAIGGANTTVPVLDYAKYSLATWEWYCKKHDIELLICDQSNFDESYKPIWNKELIYDAGKNYNKIGIVDCDTMVKWDAPNIFDIIDTGFYGVNDLADLNWLFNSIDQRQKFFPEIKMDISKYINAGVVFFRSEYLYIFKELLGLYVANKDEIDTIKSGGIEQTLLNFTLQKNNVDITLMDPSWNLLSIHKKNMFTHNWQLNTDLTPYFIKYANIWHFTGFPIEQRVDVMRQTWEYAKNNYT